ncbi:MAG: DUF883 domain-containing protein [Opitutales bacterium]|nr:DUF883 domain-containing protein [Opitutales bacterium]MCH8541487.1 hypothetical protein [Opitutales bacterium]
MPTKKRSNIKSVRKSRDQLVDDFKRVIEDFHNLAEESTNASGAAIHRGYDAVQDEIKDGMHAIHDMGDKVAAGAEYCKDSVEESISNHPWRAIAIATATGLLLNRLLRW